MNTEAAIALAGLLFGVVGGLVALAIKVGGWASRIDRNERDIGVVFEKLDEIYAYVRNGRAK